MIDKKHGWTLSLKPLLIGLVLSLIFIFAAYRIVTYYHLANTALVVTVFLLGVLQAGSQLVFFMHLGLEDKPHWSTFFFLFTILVVIIVTGGSIWIMKNLNYNLMPH